MRGDKLGKGSYTGTVSKVLATAGFKAKALVASGSADPEELESLGGKFLGLGYHPPSDEILLTITPLIRIARKRSRQRRAQAETIEDEW